MACSTTAIHPGKLNERLMVQTYSESVNELGETTLNWVDWRQIWANVEGVTASEALGAFQQSIQITHRVKCRYFDGLTQKMQFKWRGGRILQIISLLERGQRTEWEAICLESVD